MRNFRCSTKWECCGTFFICISS